jgi:hypothetical protein
MIMPRYNGRRDANDGELLQLAETLGWWMHKSQELGDYIGWRRGQWAVIEIKDPKKEGWDSEYTPKQRKFHAEAFKRCAKVLVWRSRADVVRDSGARLSA